MYEATQTEKMILDDVRAKTGLSFPHVQTARPINSEGAGVVYPVLAEWVPRVDRNHRCAIYDCFDTPYAYSYLDRLIVWWQTEESDDARSLLIYIISRLAKTKDASRLWDLSRNAPDIPFRYMLLAKLANFPQVQREVRKELVRALDDPRTGVGDLQEIAKVNDPRIREWFTRQVGSPNAALRTVAMRVVARRKPLPRGIEYPAPPPDRTQELTSTEVDIDEFGGVLRGLAKQHWAKIPTAVRSGRFLSSLEVDRWAVARTLGRKGESLGLWFRLEDIDVVEVVLTRDATGSAPPS